jgi:hypothetical protein
MQAKSSLRKFETSGIFMVPSPQFGIAPVPENQANG